MDRRELAIGTISATVTATLLIGAVSRRGGGLGSIINRASAASPSTSSNEIILTRLNQMEKVRDRQGTKKDKP